MLFSFLKRVKICRFLCLIVITIINIAELKAQNKVFTASIKGFFSSLHVTSVDYAILDFNRDMDNKNIWQSVAVRADSFRLPIQVSRFPVEVLINLVTTNSRTKIPPASRTYSFLIEKGDDISLYEQHGQYSFTGRGSEKYAFEFEQQCGPPEFGNIPVPVSDEFIANYYQSIDSLALIEKFKLDKFRTKVGEQIYSYLFAKIKSYYENIKLEQVIRYHEGGKITMVPQSLKVYKDQTWSMNDWDYYQSMFDFCPSTYFTDVVYNRYKYDSCSLVNKSFNINDFCLFLDKKLKGDFRDYSLKLSIEKNIFCDTSIITAVKNSLKIVRNPYVVTYLSDLYNSKKAGSLAYNFSLQDTVGKTVRLSDFKGKVVLLDFWFAHCGACADIHPYLDLARNKFKNREFVLIAINTDSNKNEWLNSIKNGLRTSSENVNLFTNGLGCDHPVLEKYKVNGFPAIMLIDKAGRMIDQPIDPRIDCGVDLLERIERSLN